MKIRTNSILKGQDGLVARPNPREITNNPDRVNIQQQGMKEFANYWYSERAKQPKYQSQVNLAQIQGRISNAKYQSPMEFYADPSSHANSNEIEKFIANGGNPNSLYQVAQRQGIAGAANPNKGTYTHNPSAPWSRRFADT